MRHVQPPLCELLSIIIILCLPTLEKLEIKTYPTSTYMYVIVSHPYHLQALLKLATVKANEKATLPANVEGMLHL